MSSTIYTSIKGSTFDREVQRASVENIIKKVSSGAYKIAVEQIRNEVKEKRTALKKQNLGMFYPGIEFEKYGVFDNNKWVKATGLIQFDIDEYSEKESRKIIEQLKSLSCLYYAFLSPSGGVKFALISDFQCEDMSAISDAYVQAYSIAKESVFNSGLDITLDDSTASISLGCYLSHDEDAYLNTEAEMITLNDKAFRLMEEKRQAEEEAVKDKVSSAHYGKADIETIREALGYIPRDLKYSSARQGNGRCGRFEVNRSVGSELGSSAVNLLLAHWTHSDKRKLQSDVRSQAKASGNKFTIGTLYKEATHYGWKRSALTGRHAVIRKTENNGTYQTDRVSVQKASERLAGLIDDYFDNKTDKVIFYEAGAGKTAKMIERVAEFNRGITNIGKNIAIFVKDYALADEIEAKLCEALGTDKKDNYNIRDKIAIIKGMDRLCLKKDKYSEKVFKKLGNELCSKCNHGSEKIYKDDDSKFNEIAMRSLYKKCSYISQYDMIFMNRIRIYTHNHLFHTARYDDGFKADYVIVDEDCLSNAIDLDKNTISYTKNELTKDLIHVWDDVKKGNKVNVDKNYIKNLKEEVNRLKSEKELLFENEQITLGEAGEGKFLNLSQKIDKTEDLINFSIKMNEKYSKKFISTVKDSKTGLVSDKIFVGNRAKINFKWKDTAKLFLDASGNESVMRAFVGNEVSVDKVRTHYSKNITVTQVVDKSFSKISLDEDNGKYKESIKETWKKIENFISQLKGRTCVVSYMKYKDKFLAMGVHEDDFIWFGKLRGIDRFSDYDNIVRVGRYQLASGVLKNKAMLLFDHIKSMDDFSIDERKGVAIEDMAYRKVVIETPGKQENVTVNNLRYNDASLAALSEHSDMSENYQADARIRYVHGDKKKNIFILSNAVSDIMIDKTVKWHELAGGYSKSSELKSKIIKVVETEGFIQNKAGAIAKAIGAKSKDVVNFDSRHNGWRNSFKIVVVKVTTTSRNTGIREYLVSKDFKGDICKSLVSFDEKIKKVEMV